MLTRSHLDKPPTKEPALTIDGTSPLSLSTQAISLKNDAAEAITEVDTGTLADSDTVVPTSKAVKTAVDTKTAAIADVTVTVGSGKDYETIQGAVDYFKNKQVGGTNVIVIDPGTYDEEVDISSVSLIGTLELRGDTRLLAGMAYVDGTTHYYSHTNAGTGTITFSRGGAGNTVLTVNGSTGNPDFDADGWGAGDKVLVYTGTTPNTITEMTLASASNNTLTATGAWPDPAAGVSGAGYSIALEPNVCIYSTSSSGVDGMVTISNQRVVLLTGLYLKESIYRYGLMVRDGAIVYGAGLLINSLGYTLYTIGIYLNAILSMYAYDASKAEVLTIMNSNYGIMCWGNSLLRGYYMRAIKHPTAAIAPSMQSACEISGAKIVKVGTGVSSANMSFSQVTAASFIGCTTNASPVVNTDGNGNSYNLS